MLPVEEFDAHRGQYAHSHGIGDDRDGVSRAPDFKRLGKSTVANWLQDAGYVTALVGKYLNGYESLYVPPGWDSWYANADIGVWSNCLIEDGTKWCYRERHPDSVLAEKAEGFVRANKDNSNPLFLWLSFNAPHKPAPYMQQDRNKFADAPLPSTPSFDEIDVSDKPAWVRKQERFTD